MKTTNNIYYLSLLLGLCFAFAGYNYYCKIINPFSPDVLKCEGIILNESLNYHITNKDSHQDLRRIRGNDINVSNNDVLLHYRTQDMELITPSYWGSFIYDDSNSKWNFKLDKSFSDNPKSPQNVHLPFLRKLHDDDFFFKKSTIVDESQLKERLFINTVGGSKASRYYIEIKKLNNKKTLPFYDEGIKRSYSLKNEINKVLITFNNDDVINSEDYLYRFSFNNTTNLEGVFELIYDPNKNLIIKNLDTGEVIEVKEQYFEVGDMMFSLLPRYKTSEILMLAMYILIALFSAIVFLFGIKRKTLLSTYTLNLRVCVLLFLLCGFPTLATSFDTQNFSTFRKVILAIAVPAVPYFSFFLFHRLKSKKFLYKIIKSIFFLMRRTIESKAGLGLFLVLSIALLFTTRDERVLRILPVLHYIKLVLFALFFILYSKAFAVSLRRIVVKVPNRYHTYFKSVILIAFTLACSIITKDYGSLILVLFACLLFEYSLGNLPLKIGEQKFSFLKITGIYFGFAVVVFVLGFIIEMPDKAYRLTYTFANPDSIAYQNVGDANRETISILYQNLKLLLDYPLGIQNLVIPRASLSVSHSDYSVHWAVINNGLPFLILLLLVISAFANNVFKLIFVLSREIRATEQGITAAPKRLTMFTAFILIFTLLQCLVPLASNLLLPGAFLTGIPFPGISISIGDAIFFSILFFLFDYLSSNESHLPENYKKAFTNKARQFARRSVAKIALLYIILLVSKFVCVKFIQSPETSFKTSEALVDRVNDLPTTDDREAFLDYASNYFKDKNLSRLNKKDKLTARMIACSYYSSPNIKLNGDKTNFKISSSLLEDKIVADSLLSYKKERISGDKWIDSAVYLKRHFVNGSETFTPTSKYYSNINFNNLYLDRDITALVNKEIETHLNEKLRGYNNLKANVLIVENSTRHVVVNSSYPFDSKNPKRENSFFPASYKKIILAHYYSVKESRHIESEIFESSRASRPIEWIAKSDNQATYEYWEHINLEEFKSFLEEYYKDFSYSSNALKNGYSENGVKAPRNAVIGGKIKYTSRQINNLLKICSNDVFLDNNQVLYRLLNAPLTHQRGTARQVATALEENDLDTSNYIAKTGTLEFRGRNIATSFGISNKDYTITVLIDGIQPSNRQRAAAKHLFIEIIPTIKEFL